MCFSALHGAMPFPENLKTKTITEMKCLQLYTIMPNENILNRQTENDHSLNKMNQEVTVSNSYHLNVRID